MTAQSQVKGRLLLPLLKAAATLALGLGLGAMLLFEPPIGRLDGVLTARDSGRPVANAEISLSGPTYRNTRSDEQGRFTLLDLPTGIYRVEANSPGHVLPLTSPHSLVMVTEGKATCAYLEMDRRPSWVSLVVHEEVLYPDEPLTFAVQGLTLNPSYQLDLYRVVEWKGVQEYEAMQYPKALAKAVSLGNLVLLSSRDITPEKIDPEGIFYDRVLLDPLPVGRYFVAVKGETGSYSGGSITVSRLALIVKADDVRAVAHVCDLRTGRPIAGAQVQARNLTITTDTDGFARFTFARPTNQPITYTARVGEDVVTTSTQNYWSREPYRLYAFTDRPIYRPGDHVFFKGVLRKQNGLTYDLPGRAQVKLTVTDPQDIQIHKAEFTTNGQGSYTGGFDLPAQGRAGFYSMTAKINGFTETTLVNVASYLKPEIQLTARPVKPQYVRGQLASIDIQASYYFDAPAAGLRLHWTLTRDSYYPPSAEYPDEFEREYEGEYESYGGELISEGEGMTDDRGRLRLTLPSRLPSGTTAEEDSPYYDHVFTVNIWSVGEAGGAAETTTHYLVTRGSFYLTVSPSQYVLRAGQATGLKLEARDFEGDAVSEQEIKLSLLSETTDDRGRVKRTSLRTWSVRTGTEGIANTTITPPKQGEFILEAVARDPDNRAIAVRQYLWAVGDEPWYFGAAQAEITIVSDRKQYRPTDRVKLLVTSQREGSALFSLEGDRLYEVRAIQLRRGANLIEFDLRPDYIPNVFVWIGQIEGKALHQAQQEIRISRETRRLTVEVTPGRKDYRPGETAACRVQIKDPDGRPAQAEVSVGVVDEAIYALAADTVQDPADYFYGPRWNRVQTAYSRLTNYYGGGDKAPANIEVRRKFVDTAFWSPQVMTDAQGRAEVSFKLPDNLTSWRVTARAVSADTRGGQARANFAVNKPLMVRLDLPRFVTQGDHFRLSAYIHNETDQEQQVTLDSWSRGLDLDNRRETLTVPARKVVRRDWWATATAPDKATIGASAISGTLQDALELTLPVNPFTRTQFDAWSGQTESEANLILPVRDDSTLDRNRLTIAVAPSLASSLFSSLDYLATYPYGCVEQTTSAFLPNLYVLQLLQARGLGEAPLARRLPRMVTDGLVRLASLQREEGGWGWGRWGELDIWMTSYALLAVQEAQEAGYSTAPTDLPVNALENALRIAREEYPDDLAFAAYVLARYKSELALPTLVRAEGHRKLSGRGRALCALAHFELGNTVEAQRLVLDIWRTAKPEGKLLYWTGLQDAESRWWDGGANIEATAWSLKAVLRADPKDPRTATVAGWLLQQRRGDHWLSTRDTAIALSTLVDYLRGFEEPNPNYTAIVTLNGKEILRQTYASDPATWREVTVEVPASAVFRGANKLLFSRGEGEGRLYYRVAMRQQVAIREGERTARGETFQVSREYFKLARGKSGEGFAYGPAAKAADTFNEGERVLVRLTITSTQRLRYSLVEDYFPAGLEPSARGDVGFHDWRSWWVDNDVRDDKVTFYLDWLPVGKYTIDYVVTARTPGQFSALPPVGFAMYQPEVNAVGELGRVEVKP